MTTSIAAPVDYFFFIIKVAFWAVAGLAFILTKGYTLNYFYRTKSLSEFKSLLYIQTIISVGSALLIPNMVLDRYFYFHNLYERNQLWIPFSMLVILFVSLLLFGFLFDWITSFGGRSVDTARLNESTPKWIHKVVKSGSNYHKRKQRSVA